MKVTKRFGYAVHVPTCLLEKQIFLCYFPLVETRIEEETYLVTPFNYDSELLTSFVPIVSQP